jgi:hypothetical protein
MKRIREEDDARRGEEIETKRKERESVSKKRRAS